MKTAALYIRVSTDKQEELSPDAQKRLLIEYTKKNNMLINKSYIFIENGISGKKADRRPEFQKMIALAKSKDHPIDVILVWKYSRFARNQEESIVYKSLLRKQCNVEVISVSEPLIDGPFGSLIERIIEWMDEYYSIRLSGEVFRGMTEKAMRGGYQAALPLGYKKVNQTPAIVEDEATIVRLIYQKYLDGMDISAIARYLNSLAYKTNRNNPFEYRTIKYILENPFYIGKVRWNRAKHSSHISNPENEIIVADGIHDSIINMDIWNKVQEQIKIKSLPYKAKTMSSCKHWLSGLLKCSVCGKSLVYQSPKKWNPYFQCYAYSKGAHIGSQAISESKIVPLVMESIKNVLDTGNIYFEQKKVNQSVNDFELERLNSELQRIGQKEKRVKAAYIDGVDSIEEYKANKKALNNERLKLEEKINSIIDPQSKDISKDEYLIKVKSTYDTLISDADYVIKGNAIRGIIDQIIYNRDKNELEVSYYI